MTATPTETAQSPPVRHVLQNPDFRFVWIGFTLSLFGAEFSFVALPWLVLQLTGSSVALGTILMAESLPRAALMLFGGAASDRFSLRQILYVTTTVHMVVVTSAAALVHYHAAHLWHLYVLAFIFGVADAFGLPARQALIPSVVTEEELPGANSLISGSAQISAIVGPAPAGVVLKIWGAASAFLVDAVCFVVVLLALFRLKKLPEKQGNSLPGMWRPILDGLRYVAADAPLRSLMLLTAVLNLGVSGPLVVGLALLAKDRFSSASAFGTMLSVMAAGALLGSLVPILTKTHHHRGSLVLAFSGVLGMGMIAIGLLHRLMPVLAILAVLGFGNGLVAVHLTSWFQTRVERKFLGRVMSLSMFASLGLTPLSYPLAGALARVSLALMFLCAGFLLLVTTMAAALHPEVRNID
ncbi:MAG TPA: MFS transporter [Candidatus Angelobacter sp.]|nr:MFS transporter [Candidatus Angelobacter sp.]